MNGMTAKELEKEKMGIARMGFELKSKRQVSRGVAAESRRGGLGAHPLPPSRTR